MGSFYVGLGRLSRHLLRAARGLYARVLLAAALGAVIGHLWPNLGVALGPLGEGFIRLVKMVIGPLVFCTVVSGIGRAADLKKIGRIGLKSILYFEVISTAALGIGLIVGAVVRPGAGVRIDLGPIDPGLVPSGGTRPHQPVDFLLGIIPSTPFEAFAKGDLLSILFFSILFATAAARAGPAGAKVIDWTHDVGQVLFRIVQIIMALAPLGALGAIGHTVGRHGLFVLWSLGKLVLTFYATSLLFFVLLGLILWKTKVRLVPLLRYLLDEVGIVLSTSSSESVLPRMLTKLTSLGCSESVVGLTVPLGYSFNLDGTAIYLTLATGFLAQASGTHLSLREQLSLLGVMMLSSKGAAAVTGGGFIALAATLSAFPSLPLAGLPLLLGVDRFMSEARAVTNLIGNAVATVVIADWEGELDHAQVENALRQGATDRPTGSGFGSGGG